MITMMIVMGHVPLVDDISCAHMKYWLKSVVVISSRGELTHNTCKNLIRPSLTDCVPFLVVVLIY